MEIDIEKELKKLKKRLCCIQQGGSGNGENIYNSNGSLTQDRTVDINNYLLTFSNGEVKVGNYIPSLLTISPASTYDNIIESGSDYGATQYLWALNTSHKSRVRQNGNIKYVQFFIENLPSRITSFFFSVWRKNGTTYDLIGQENILSKMSAGFTNLIELTTPIAAQEGDYIGWGYNASAAGTFFLKSGSATSGLRFQTTSSQPTTGYNWDSLSSLNNYLPLKVYMDAPDTVFIGDSIVAGYNSHVAYLINSPAADNPSTSFPYKVGNGLSWSYQNMGIGGNTSSQVLSRFEADVCSLKPRYAVILVGVNDIATGVSQSTFINNYTAILELCQTYEIKPVVLGILPWTNGTNPQMQQRDIWNAALQTLVGTYNGIYINADTAIGQNRVGGDVGNLWNIQPSFTDDGVHLTNSGNTALANYIISQMSLYPAEPPKDFTSKTTLFSVNTNNHSLGLPVLTESERNSILPSYASLIFNSTKGVIEDFNGSFWQSYVTRDKATFNNSLFLRNTTNQNVGVIYKNGKPFLHNYNPSGGSGWNTFLGEDSGGFSLSSVGNPALNGAYNTGLGAFSLRINTTGYNNTGVGGGTLYTNSTGQGNTAVGLSALLSSTTGNQNTCVGAFSSFQSSGSQASNNCSLGYYTLFSNLSGYENIAVGVQSLYSLNSGYRNVALGNSTLYSITSGHENVGLGYQAGYGDGLTANNRSTVDQRMTFIGSLASRHESIPQATPILRSTAIGFNSKVSTNDTVVLGDTNAQVVIGNHARNESAALGINSTTKGFLPPRMTATQAEAIVSPEEGLLVYSTNSTGVIITSKGWWGYDGATWVKLN